MLNFFSCTVQYMLEKQLNVILTGEYSCSRLNTGISPQIFTCSKSTIETPEQWVKYVHS